MNLQLLDAAPSAGTGGMDMSFWIMIIAMFAILYFFMIRPQNKRRKELQNFRNSLQVGSKVITAGGILGTVKDLNEGETYITVEIANGVKIQIDRNYVFSNTNAQAPQ